MSTLLYCEVLRIGTLTYIFLAFHSEKTWTEGSLFLTVKCIIHTLERRVFPPHPTAYAGLKFSPLVLVWGWGGGGTVGMWRQLRRVSHRACALLWETVRRWFFIFSYKTDNTCTDTIFKESLPAGPVLQAPRPLSKGNSCFWFCVDASRVILQYRYMLFKI